MQINLSTNWKNIIEQQQALPYWLILESAINQAYKNSVVYPKQEEIFKCFNYFNVEQTKVVIIGQDPYPTPGDANGLAFSVNREHNLPYSLMNIFQELKTDLSIHRNNGDLSDWAKQGVLLLNSALTFSRQRTDFLPLWKPFTECIIKYIDQHIDGVIFILWGNFAKEYAPLIINNQQYIISSGHPSFAASHRLFFNTKPFSRTNNLLKQLNKTPIIW